MGQGKDKAPRTRRQKSPAERAVTAASTKAKRVAAATTAKQRFVASLSSGSGATSTSCQPAQELGENHPQSDGVTAAGTAATGSDVRGSGEEVASGGSAAPAAPDPSETANEGVHQHPRPLEHPDDDVNCVDIGEKDGALDAIEVEDSVMKVYSRKILERLRKELSSTGPATDNWLLRKLRENGWRLRAADARDTMMQLGADSDPAGWEQPFYIRDIFIWLPDVRWGEMPPCPHCCSTTEVSRHDFLLKQPTRR